MVGSRACAVANAMSHRIVSLVRSQVCIVQLLQMYVTGTIQPAQLTCTIHHCWHTLLLISGQRLALGQHARALRFQGSGPRGDCLIRCLYRCVPPAQHLLVFGMAKFRSECIGSCVTWQRQAATPQMVTIRHVAADVAVSQRTALECACSASQRLGSMQARGNSAHRASAASASSHCAATACRSRCAARPASSAPCSRACPGSAAEVDWCIGHIVSLPQLSAVTVSSLTLRLTPCCKGLRVLSSG